jgi:hypothetical protein
LNVKRVLDSLNLDQIRTDLAKHYHTDGPGRTPINPLFMLKAQLAKHLLTIISDRRLALRLKHDWKVARACVFRRQTPSHGLFTHFRCSERRPTTAYSTPSPEYFRQWSLGKLEL